MSSVETNDVITHLRIAFSGSGYQSILGKATKKAFSTEQVAPIVRGQKSAAAGCGISVDIVVTIAANIASGLMTEALIRIFRRIKKTTMSTIGDDCHIGGVTIETEGCDYRIRVNGGAGVLDSGVDYSGLISKMIQLRELERRAGRVVISIDAPCDLVPHGESFDVRNAGIGNFSLWLVSYQEGERWPSCLYDAINERFIALSGAKAINVVKGDDAFYNF